MLPHIREIAAIAVVEQLKWEFCAVSNRNKAFELSNVDSCYSNMVSQWKPIDTVPICTLILNSSSFESSTIPQHRYGAGSGNSSPWETATRFAYIVNTMAADVLVT